MLKTDNLNVGLTQLAQAMPAAGYAYAKLKYICIIQAMQLAQIGSGRSPATRQFKLNQAHIKLN
ncbi:hypothetical protein NSP_4800 [Nodularia spumigena CCY9414]|nr:hypothetical protein NSP_4800 [Nodularia spumigena CCY9414]EAW45242.1 bifunctional phosphoribosylaminoimidazolecarboxamide formyltransferase/IMP cyclohydrolase [Nodularia spumigena CCY9414]